MDKFTIVVPVYNAEQYIDQCISSLINQSYPNLEIILIDDGSSDKSYEICTKYASVDKRIKLIKNCNHGVSYTRNFGIDIATGKYITFVDSDDWLELEAIKKVSEIFAREEVDVVQTNLLYCTDKLKENRYPQVINDILDNNSFDELKKSIISSYYLQKKMKNQLGPVRCIGGKFYKTSILKENNIHFNNNIYILEDGIFNLNIYDKIKKIYICNYLLYNYRQNPTSTTFKYNSNQFEQSNIINDILFNYIKNLNSNSVNFYMVFYLNCFELLSTYIYREQREKKYNYNKFKKNIINRFMNSNYFYVESINYINFNYLTKKGKIILFLIKYKLFYILYVLCKLKEKKEK